MAARRWRRCPRRCRASSAPPGSRRSPATATSSGRCRRTARAWVRYSLVNWASTLTYQAPTFAMPVIVLVNVSADDNASFYVAWGVAAVACYVPTAIGQALLAEGGRDGAQLRTQVRLAIVVAGGLMVVGAAVATLGPRPDRHPLRRRVPGGGRHAPSARGRRDPLGGHLRVPHRGPRAAPQRAPPCSSPSCCRPPSSCPRSCSCPRTGSRGRRRLPLRQHRGGRGRPRHPPADPTHRDGPIPATSPDDFEPEDAIALTPNPLT